jgi:large subunit ribosomal protein L25
MDAITLEAALRDDAEVGKSHTLRKAGFVPCVVYGEGKKTLALKIERSRLIKFMHAHHGGENMVITLKISGGKKAEDKAVLIKEVQIHPVMDDILHVDFNEISLTKRLTVKVPIETVGEAPGVKLEGGILEHVLWEVEVECLPTQIPEKLLIDIANMKIDDIVHLKDLKVPEGVVIKHDLESIVLQLRPPLKEEPVAAEAGAEVAPGSTEPEVIKKEKKPAEGEEEVAAEKK